MSRLCVFCGSRPGTDPVYADAARKLGRSLVERGCALVYGGGSTGLMGALADTVLDAGGEAIGVVPGGLFADCHLHKGLSDTVYVDSMSERKNVMTALSEGFLILPGGLGTLDEMFELWAGRQLEIHDHPIGLLNTAGYYDPLLRFLSEAVACGYLDEHHRHLLHVAASPGALLDVMLS